MNLVRDVSTAYLFLFAMSLLMLFSASNSCAQSTTTNTPCVSSFLSDLLGEWVGTCEQRTENGEPDKQFFHVVLKRSDDGSFQSTFQFFRQDKTGLVPCGETNVVINCDGSGSAVSKIKGNGKIMVKDKLADQRYELTETLSYADNGGLKSKGSGSISVSGMPLGAGKNGKVKECQSVWTIKGGELAIDQKMSISFKILFASKNVAFQAHYAARRGSDVSALLNSKPRGSLAAPSGCGAGALVPN